MFFTLNISAKNFSPPKGAGASPNPPLNTQLNFSINGLYRSLKRGMGRGYISGVHFQKCLKFSIFLHIEISVQKILFTSKGEGVPGRKGSP